MDKKYFKDIAILLGIILVAAIGARVLGKGETLDEYAKKTGQTIENTDNTSIKNMETSVEEDQAELQNTPVESTLMEKDYSSDTNSNDNVNTHSSDDITENNEKASYESPVKSDQEISEEDSAGENAIVYAEDFYYEPISNDIFKRISGISYPVDCTVPLDDLRYLSLKYVDFNGDDQTGEMICYKDIAQDVVEIFYELYKNGYQIESIKLIDEFDGDDTASMEANNTSCFNYRVVEGTTRLSKHAYGLAIDLNPFYNPYITYPKDGTVKVSPEGSEKYADRSIQFPYKIDESDLAYKLFKEHGFTWGGNWNSVKDYQHFERSN